MQIRHENKIPLQFWKKFTFGFLFLCFLLGILILPILLFSTLNPNYIINEPLSVKLDIKIWAMKDESLKSFPIFSTTDVSIKDITDSEYTNQLANQFSLRTTDKIS